MRKGKRPCKNSLNPESHLPQIWIIPIRINAIPRMINVITRPPSLNQSSPLLRAFTTSLIHINMANIQMNGVNNTYASPINTFHAASSFFNIANLLSQTINFSIYSVGNFAKRRSPRYYCEPLLLLPTNIPIVYVGID